MSDRTVVERLLELVQRGVLVLDEEGRIWRLGWFKTPEDYRTYATPRRAEATGPKGYLRIVVWMGGKARHLPAHRLIWEVLKGPIPPGLEINHIDGNKRNNRIDNLEVVTPGQNGRHAARTRLRPPAWSRCGKAGRTPRGFSLVPEETILAIVESLSAGEMDSVVAERYGLTTEYVYGLRYRRMGKIPAISEEKKTKIFEMLDRGCTNKEIIKEVHAAPYTVINLQRSRSRA